MKTLIMKDAIRTGTGNRESIRIGTGGTDGGNQTVGTECEAASGMLSNRAVGTECDAASGKGFEAKAHILFNIYLSSIECPSKGYRNSIQHTLSMYRTSIVHPATTYRTSI